MSAVVKGSLAVLRDLFVPSVTQRPGLRRSFAYLAVIVAITAVIFREPLLRRQPFVDDGHAKVSIGLAVNRAFCGARGLLSRDRQIGEMVIADPALAMVPVRELLASRWGTVASYCATVTTPFMLSENSLMLSESWVLTLVPGVSISGVGQILLAWRFAMIALLAFGLLVSGNAVIVALGVMQVGAILELQLQQTSNQSVYPFLFCMIAMAIGMYGIALDRRVVSRLGAFSVIAGGVTAYIANMRTSYLPLLVVLFIAYLAAALATRPRGPGRTRLLWLAPVLFVAGYSAFQYWFIVRTRPANNVAMSYHVIAHPLVLSLGQPPSGLANREGIVWNDALGLGIARRVDPTVEYLGPGYERALFRYYFGLWRKYPDEMIGIYANKWREAGVIIVEYARFGSRWTEELLTPWRKLPNGLCFLGIFAGGIAVAFAAYRRSRAPVFYMLGAISVVALLLISEAATIMTSLSLQYHAPLILMCCALSLIGVQWAVAAAVAAAPRIIEGARPMGLMY